MMSTRPAATTLAGYTVAVTDFHQELVAAQLRRRGATVVEVPLLRMVPAGRDARLRAATRHCVSAAVDYTLAASAAGWLRWLDAAQGWQLRAALLATLESGTILSTGPSVSAALRDSGLTETWASPSGELGTAIAWLLRQELARRRVVWVADEAPPPRLITALRAGGATVIVVPTRRWAPPSGLGPVHTLVRMVTHREVHAVTFAAIAGVTALIEVAERTDRGEGLLRAFATDVLAAAADAGCAGPLIDRAIPVRWVAGARPDGPGGAARSELGSGARGDPDGAAGALAGLVTEALVARRRELRAGADRFTVQGDAVVVGGAAIRLDSAAAAVVRALADHPGQTLSRATIAQLAPLSRRAGPLGVDLAVSRLRAALGGYQRLVETVPGQGYRLAVDG